MKRLIVASNNEHKIKEIKQILKKFPLEVVSLKEADINIDVEEDGATFMENAYKKASEIYKIKPDSYILADDSGLSVDVLGGAPGVYSARFAGEHGNDRKNNEKLLELLKGKGKSERKARFICAMALITDDERVIKVQGEAEGYILEGITGDRGFGYDPLFYVPECGMTFGQMSEDAKNSVSHRAKALEKLEKELEKIL